MALPTDSDAVPHASVEDRVLSVTLGGDVNVTNVPDVRLALSQLIKKHAPQKLVVDMSRVSYMDSSGLAVLVEARRQAGSGTPMVLANINKDVLGLMKIMNLHMLFQFEDQPQG